MLIESEKEKRMEIKPLSGCSPRLNIILVALLYVLLMIPQLASAKTIYHYVYTGKPLGADGGFYKYSPFTNSNHVSIDIVAIAPLVGGPTTITNWNNKLKVTISDGFETMEIIDNYNYMISSLDSAGLPSTWYIFNYLPMYGDPRQPSLGTFHVIYSQRNSYEYFTHDSSQINWPDGSSSLGINRQSPGTWSLTVTEIPDNTPPVANAGPDQTVNETGLVTLSGAESKDPEGQPITYQWLQLAGTPVALNLSDPSHPTFSAPAVALGGETLTFQLIVSDGALSSVADTVNISVKNVNHAPVADAGIDVTVGENSQVRLDGSASYDADGDNLSYSWSQTDGPSVVLMDSTKAQLIFTAPTVGVEGQTLRFALTVSDGIDTATDTVDIFVENINHAPVANGGVDQIRNEGSRVLLNGNSSSDADGDPLTFTWTQVDGYPVSLIDNHSSTPSFTAPIVGPEGAKLVFQLVVNDGLLESAPAFVTVSVADVNAPPSCATAKASLGTIWPPNHKLIPIEIANVKDPDNDQVKITVLDVTQDEPINGLGDGDTDPDAVIQGNGVLLRAERSGGGNGRVYAISFKAEDSFGESCNGVVTVTVPHSRGEGSKDDGQNYKSLAPLQ